VRKLGIAVLVLLTFGVGSALAQTQISLGGSTQNVTLVTNGSGGATVTLGSCSGGTCTLSGTAFGTGALSSGPAAYSITTASTNSITMSWNGSIWNVSQSDPIYFCYGGSGSCDGSLLTGTLTLGTFGQAGQTGTFNTQLTGNLAITGGSLASLFPNNLGMLSFTVDLPNATDLSTSEGQFAGSISSGELKPTPEPATLGLLGSGLMLLGGAIRRRFI